MLRNVSSTLYLWLCVLKAGCLIPIRVRCDYMLSCTGGAAGGGYAQVIPMEEVRQWWGAVSPCPSDWSCCCSTCSVVMVCQNRQPGALGQPQPRHWAPPWGQAEARLGHEQLVCLAWWGLWLGRAAAAGDQLCCSMAGAEADGTGDWSGVPGCGGAPGAQAATVRASGALSLSKWENYFLTCKLICSCPLLTSKWVSVEDGIIPSSIQGLLKIMCQLLKELAGCMLLKYFHCKNNDTLKHAPLSNTAFTMWSYKVHAFMDRLGQGQRWSIDCV